MKSVNAAYLTPVLAMLVASVSVQARAEGIGDEISIDPALEQLLSTIQPDAILRDLPIKKLVIETTIKPKRGGEATATYDCHFAYAGSGVVIKSCEKRWSNAKELTSIEISFMGLSPSLVAASGYKSEINSTTVTRSFITNRKLPLVAQNQIKMTRWAADLTAIAYPKANSSWEESYTYVQDISVSSVMARKERHAHSGSRQCRTKSFSPASLLHERLIGETLQVDCNVIAANSTAISSEHQWAYLIQSGLYFSRRIASEFFEMNSRIVEVEYY